ncbi:hypothetical protein POM88_050340 [Heracleum sosnowskyi]|uniref:Uncharacterized protein n=1 Tax=Heracleum sosnowskyi TaxID=360622 RepID=A0AAD8GYI5_9APIA|nr:hypothetical protein POM88_050340 [Heracleum sosnowskyi]
MFQRLYRNGLLHEFAGDGASGLPDQVFGVYFGWAKDESSKILKILMSVKWDGGCCSINKVIDIVIAATGDPQNSFLPDYNGSVAGLTGHTLLVSYFFLALCNFWSFYPIRGYVHPLSNWRTLLFI